MLILLLITMASPVSPKTHSPQKVQISADRVEIIHRSGQVEFTGNVVVIRGSLKLSCTQLTGRYKDKKLTQLTANGDVKVEKDNIGATAQQAVYDQQKQTLILTGKPTMSRHGSRLVGRRILIWLNSERIVVEKPKGLFDLKQLEQMQQRQK